MSAAPDLLTLAAELEADAQRPAWNPSRRSRDAARQRDTERLEPVALALAARVGAAGFTADDLRAAGIEAKVLTGEEGKATRRQRALSWLGPFLVSLAKRGLIAPLTYPDGNKVRRASDRPESHANAQVVYTLPAFSRVIR